MRRLILSFASIVFAVCMTVTSGAYAQCDNAPVLTTRGMKLLVSGRAVHLEGVLPKRGERWFFNVSCRSSRLFNFSLWTFERYADKDGFYRAKSWNVQVLDADDQPEREVIFEQENSLWFWGNVKIGKDSASVQIDSVVGMPDGLHGSIRLPAVHSASMKKPD